MVLYWLRKDLRVNDNSVITEYSSSRCKCVFTWAPKEMEPWAPGEASQVWLEQSLSNHASNLKNRGVDLSIEKGESSFEILKSIVQKESISKIVFQWSSCPQWQLIERKTREKLLVLGIEVNSYSDNIWTQPYNLKTKTGNFYKVFTPFYKNLLTQHWDFETTNPSYSINERREALNFKLIDSKQWGQKILNSWNPGEWGANEALEEFLKYKIEKYQVDRDYPVLKGTSRLSPHLVWGEISVKKILRELNLHYGDSFRELPFTRQLAWREFAMYLIRYFPHSKSESLNLEYANFPYVNNEKWLDHWKKGETGFDIIDAAQKELWETGWMHNRMRMLSASFLIKDLNISWKEGAKWFWETLVDADLANNQFGWQWAAGVGADAAPYFRVFNPHTQHKKFDSESKYCAKYLKNPNILVSEIVDHDEQRLKALDRYKSFKEEMKN